MVRVPVSDQDRVHVLRAEREVSQALAHMVEKLVVAWIHEDPFFAVNNEISIAVVGHGMVPQESVEFVADLHVHLLFKVPFEIHHHRWEQNSCQARGNVILSSTLFPMEIIGCVSYPMKKTERKGRDHERRYSR